MQSRFSVLIHGADIPAPIIIGNNLVANLQHELGNPASIDAVLAGLFITLHPVVNGYIEKPETNYETDPQIERVIRELRESGQSWSFDSVLGWLYSSSLMSADELRENGCNDPEYIQWNIVTFWNTTHEYVARIELDDEAKLKYEHITRRAYHKEFHKFLRSVREMAQDLRYRYNALGEVKVVYSENEKGGWSLEYKTDCFKPNIPETK